MLSLNFCKNADLQKFKYLVGTILSLSTAVKPQICKFKNLVGTILSLSAAVKTQICKFKTQWVLFYHSGAVKHRSANSKT